MTDHPVLCIGAVLWDIIGRTASAMRVGSDVPGRITRLPGGVALNIAMTLRRFGARTELLGAVGTDPEGDDLIDAITELGLGTRMLYRSADLPTDRYMAIEGAGGLIAAIADAHSLEAAGPRILEPLSDGRLGSPAAPFSGMIALDGNLTEALLGELSRSPLLAASDVRVAPASPGKASRLLPFIERPSATLYVNLEEAGTLCQRSFAEADTAARALVERGARRALVTAGGAPAADCGPSGCVTACPPEVLVTRVTGAGDTFMAAHMMAEARGSAPQAALDAALEAAAAYVSGDTGL